MRSLLFIALFNLCCYTLTAQVNYVLNPSLEKYDTCPVNDDNIRDAYYWSAIDSTGAYRISGGDGQPEFCNSCDTFSTSLIMVPLNAFFYHYPRTGNGMAEVLMFTDSTLLTGYYQRDYLQGRLYKPLTANTTYCVSFYTTKNQGGAMYAINHIGAYLDDGHIDTTINPGLPQTEYIPQIVETGILSDTLNWVKIEGSFTANGTEKFITIGDFYDIVHTNHIISNSNSQGGTAYYLVDDISVIESDTKAFAWGADTLHKGYLDSFLLGRDETIPGIKWWRDGVLIDTLHAGIWCKDDTVGSYHTYIVEQTLCGVTTYDTVVVSVGLVSIGVKAPSGSPQGGEFAVWPNPSKSAFTISGNINSREATIEILNALGQTVYKNVAEIEANHLEKQMNLNLPAGIYILRIKTEGGNSVMRLVINQ